MKNSAGMKNAVVSTGIALAGLALLAGSVPPAQALCAAPPSVNGVWKANDGGTYRLHAVGSTIWWVGMSGDDGRSWTNVFRGTRSGDIVDGEWADVRGQPWDTERSGCASRARARWRGPAAAAAGSAAPAGAAADATTCRASRPGARPVGAAARAKREGMSLTSPAAVFVASSLEGLEVAKAVRALLLQELGGSARVTPWTREFDLSATYIESLEKAARQADFAVLVVTPDDVSISRSRKRAAPRDNVVFELGLFMGCLGRERCFIVSEDRPDLKLPSDLLGVHLATFGHRAGADLRDALDAPCLLIGERIGQLGACYKPGREALDAQAAEQRRARTAARRRDGRARPGPAFPRNYRRPLSNTGTRSMSSLVAIAYSSTVVRRLGVEEIDAILSEARDYNRHAKVTGALLHHRDAFFQYIEGPPDGVEDVYRRIRASGKHTGIVESLRSGIEARRFSHWYMAFAEAPPTLMQRLASSQWEVALPSLQDKAALSPGLELLLGFWSRAGAKPAADAAPPPAASQAS